MRSRESGPIRASGWSTRFSHSGASAPSVTTASTCSSIKSSITWSLSGTAMSVAFGKLARATCSRYPPRFTAMRICGRSSVAEPPQRSGLRASATASVSATATVKRPAADRSGRTVTPDAATSKRPAASADTSSGQWKRTNTISRLRSAVHARRSATSNPSGSARSFFAWLNGA